MKKTTLTLWEAFCVLFVLCTHRLLVRPLHQAFAAAGSAAPRWAAAAFLLSLGLFALILQVPALRRLFLSSVFRAMAMVYWLLTAVFALKEGTAALQQTFYPQSPFWFLAFFLLAAALVPVLLRRRTVFRLFSLLAPPLAVLLLLFLLFALPKASLGRLSLPSASGNGLALFALSLDWVFLLPLLLPEKNKEKGRLCRLLPLGFGFLAAFLIFFIFALLGPVCTDLALPFYTLAKTEPLLLGVYLLMLLLSLLLFLMLALDTAVRYAASFSLSQQARKTLAAFLCVCLCLPLSGCYDSREVEEGAYVMALGTDKGEGAPFLYTFQIAVPAAASAEGESSSGVTHFTAEAESLSLAMVKLRSFIGKEPDLSHLKAAFFATEVAKEGLEEHTRYLLSKTAVSPSAFLCLCENANQFLEEIKPTLEKNMARFYDLLFRGHNSPFAPIVSLYDFSAALAGRPTQTMPMAQGTQLAGMGIFQAGALVSLQDTPKTVLNLMLQGQAKDLPVAAEQSVFSVTCKGTPPITFSDRDESTVYVCPLLEVTLLSGTEEDFAALCASLESGMTKQLRALTAEGLDLLNMEESARRLGQNVTAFGENLQKYKVFTKSTVKIKGI